MDGVHELHDTNQGSTWVQGTERSGGLMHYSLASLWGFTCELICGNLIEYGAFDVLVNGKAEVPVTVVGICSEIRSIWNVAIDHY